MRTTTRPKAGSASVAAWRREQLVAAGFSRPLADGLAQDGRYDLHALIELVEAGCPPPLAMRIVAPLDEEASA